MSALVYLIGLIVAVIILWLLFGQSDDTAASTPAASTGSTPAASTGSSSGTSTPPAVPAGKWDSWGQCGSGIYKVNRGWSPTTSPQPEGASTASCLTYKGCYTDKAERAIKNWQNGYLTFDECYAKAAAAKAPFFSLQWWGNGKPTGASAGTCFYGNPDDSIDSATKYGTATTCTANGPSYDLGTGAGPVFVGGSWSNALYSIDALP